MTTDPYTYDPVSLGLRFKRPIDVLDYHPAETQKPVRKVASHGKQPMTPEQKACKARADAKYQASEKGKAKRAASRKKRKPRVLSAASKIKRNAREMLRKQAKRAALLANKERAQTVISGKRGLDSSLVYSRA